REPGLLEHDVLQQLLDEECFAATGRRRCHRPTNAEGARDAAQYAVDGRAFLRAASEIHTAEQNLFFEVRGREHTAQQIVQQRAERSHLLRERENTDASARIALAVHT